MTMNGWLRELRQELAEMRAVLLVLASVFVLGGTFTAFIIQYWGLPDMMDAQAQQLEGHENIIKTGQKIDLYLLCLHSARTDCVELVLTPGGN